MSGNRVTFYQDGTLDEVVTDAGAHLENLDKNRWFLSMKRSDGTDFCIWLKGRITLTEERADNA